MIFFGCGSTGLQDSSRCRALTVLEVRIVASPDAEYGNVMGSTPNLLVVSRTGEVADDFLVVYHRSLNNFQQVESSARRSSVSASKYLIKFHHQHGLAPPDFVFDFRLPLSALEATVNLDYPGSAVFQALVQAAVWFSNIQGRMSSLEHMRNCCAKGNGRGGEVKGRLGRVGRRRLWGRRWSLIGSVS